MNTQEIKRRISQLDFLKTFLGEIDLDHVFRIRDWAHAFSTTRQQILSLSAEPEIQYSVHSGIIHITSTLLGTSEISGAFQQYPDASSSYAYAWNSLYFDSDITSPGNSLVLMAPRWKVSGPCKINLSGAEGRNGERGAPGNDGAPGEPGQNGGHFYGVFDDIIGEDNLVINTKGGNGGNGGNGGDGADGLDGADAVPIPISKLDRTNTFMGNQGKGNIYRRETMMIVTHDNVGEDGTPGFNGGRGGLGGGGGLSGTASQFERVHYLSGPGSCGENGISGRGGEGGRHGRHYTGKITQNISFQDVRFGRSGEQIMGAGAMPDRVTLLPNYRDRDPARAPDGQPGTGFSDREATPPAQSPGLNGGAIGQDYSERLGQIDEGAGISPFIRPFRGSEAL